MANVVTVQPGGKTFTTIQEAINSITDSSEMKWYSVMCSPGTYNEQVTLKPWIFVIGMDPESDNTVIVANADNQRPGTVIAASNSGVTACTIISNATTSSNSTPCAVLCISVQKFKLLGCKLSTPNTAPGTHQGIISTIDANVYRGYGSPSDIFISNCTVNQECPATSSGPSMNSVSIGKGAKLNMIESTVSCINSPDSATALLAIGGDIEVSYSSITCPKMALCIDDGNVGGKIKATRCKISGGISKGVVIIND